MTKKEIDLIITASLSDLEKRMADRRLVQNEHNKRVLLYIRKLKKGLIEPKKPVRTVRTFLKNLPKPPQK